MASKKKFKKYTEIDFDEPTRKDFLALINTYLVGEIKVEQFIDEMVIYFVNDYIDLDYFNKVEKVTVERLLDVCSEYFWGELSFEKDDPEELQKVMYSVVDVFTEFQGVNPVLRTSERVDSFVYRPIKKFVKLPFTKFVKEIKGDVNVVDADQNCSLLELMIHMLPEEEYSSEDTLCKLKYLLEKGVQLDLLLCGDDVLHQFIYAYGNYRRDAKFALEVIDLLISYGADVNIRNSYGETLVYAALTKGKMQGREYIEVYKHLLEAGFNYLGEDYHGKRTLDYLRELPQGGPVMLLIPQYGKFRL